MRKREKRTGTWHGLGNLLSLEIDDRVHDVRTSGNRQKHEDKKFGVKDWSRYWLEWESGNGGDELITEWGSHSTPSRRPSSNILALIDGDD
jgi:hypothetical protein